MTAQQLAERCKDFGVPIHRTTITKIENGRPRFDLGELLVLAGALNVAPVALLYPDLPDGEVERLPGSKVDSASAVRWFTGERRDFEPDGNLNTLLRLTRARYRKFEQLERADDLLFRLNQRGQEIKKEDLTLVADLVEEADEIERQMQEIPGSKVWRGHIVPLEEDEDG